MKEGPCCYCGCEIDGMFVSTGDGKKAHVTCYNVMKPPRLAESAEDVVCGMSDPVLVRELILETLTLEQRVQLVEKFNKRLVALHVNRCQV